MKTMEQLVAGQPVMAIFRNMNPPDAVGLAERAWDLGIDLVEVPIQTPEAIPSLQAVVRAGRERGKLVGSGTVTTPEQVRASIDAGVAFTVSPGLNEEVVALGASAGIPHLPGVATPSEIMRALRLGCTWLKAFPASTLGTDWFTAMRGPFPSVRFVATGGLNAKNAAEYLDAGASCIGVGSALADPEQVDLLAELIGTRGTGAGQ